VDGTIATLLPLLSADDTLIDGGNEWWEQTEARAAKLAPHGVHYLGLGVSGGETGARHGPSLMPGGPRAAFDRVEPILSKIAAQVGGAPCVTYLGPGGAGNYVKMVHNGIEYGDMQLIAEAYDVLRTVCGMTNREIAAVFESWNQDGEELQSYLVEITARVLRVADKQGSSGDLLDVVLDKTGMKGTGTWTVRDAALEGVPVPTIAAALTARQLAAMHAERQTAAKLYGSIIAHGSTGKSVTLNDEEKYGVVEAVKQALYASKIASYAQGMALLRTKSSLRGWELPLAEIARIWTGGCIIRAAFLATMQRVYAK